MDDWMMDAWLNGNHFILKEFEEIEQQAIDEGNETDAPVIGLVAVECKGCGNNREIRQFLHEGFLRTFDVCYFCDSVIERE